MSLTKQQKRSLKLLGYFIEDENYSEDQVREAIGMKADEGKTICWEDATLFVFYYFDKFSAEFKREVKENYVQELMKEQHICREDAIRRVDATIAIHVFYYIKEFVSSNHSSNEVFEFLHKIKEGYFNEFININDVRGQ